MSKLVRVDEECEEILRKYSEGSISDCIRAMDKKIIGSPTQTSVDTEVVVRKVIKEELSKEMQQLKEGIRGSLKNLSDMIISGQGILNRDHVVKGPMGPSVGPSIGVTVEPPLDHGSAFVRASELKNEYKKESLEGMK